MQKCGDAAVCGVEQSISLQRRGGALHTLPLASCAEPECRSACSDLSATHRALGYRYVPSSEVVSYGRLGEEDHSRHALFGVLGTKCRGRQLGDRKYKLRRTL